MRFPVAWSRSSQHRQVDLEPVPVVSTATGLKRTNATKRRRRTAPPVTERASSLYHRQESVVSDFTASSPSSISSHSYTIHTPSSAYSTSSSYNTHLYHLKENPSLFFPTPPPRLAAYDDKRHTDIWDDLFDYAEAHSTYGQATLQQLSPCHSSLDLSESKTKKAKRDIFGLKGLAMRSEIWSKAYSPPMATSVDVPPVVPPRSRLRSQAPAAMTSLSSFILPADELLIGSSQTTPPLSASGSSDHGSPALLPASPPSDTIAFGKKKKSTAGLGKDPLRVKDGAQPRRASSGVYTPTTFPGAAGPRPSHFPSHVYTPTNFTLYPAPPMGTPSQSTSPESPSRSSSFSSAESDTPQTPGSRFSTISGKALTSLKRISHQIPRVTQPPVISAPMSARDSYFPSTIHNDAPRVWAPQTPVVSVRPMSSQYDVQSPSGHGLGMGLTEQNGAFFRQNGAFFRPDEKPRMTPSVLFDEPGSEGTLGTKSSPQPKGRRKPVPKILDDQIQLKMDELKLESNAS